MKNNNTRGPYMRKYGIYTDKEKAKKMSNAIFVISYKFLSNSVDLMKILPLIASYRILDILWVLVITAKVSKSLI